MFFFRLDADSSRRWPSVLGKARRRPTKYGELSREASARRSSRCTSRADGADVYPQGRHAGRLLCPALRPDPSSSLQAAATRTRIGRSRFKALQTARDSTGFPLHAPADDSALLPRPQRRGLPPCCSTARCPPPGATERSTTRHHAIWEPPGSAGSKGARLPGPRHELLRPLRHRAVGE